MSWEEFVKTKRDVQAALDDSVGKKTDAASTSSGATLFSWTKSVYNHLTSYLSSTRMAKIDTIAASAVIANGSSVKRIIRGTIAISGVSAVTVSVSSYSINPAKCQVTLTGAWARYERNPNGAVVSSDNSTAIMVPPYYSLDASAIIISPAITLSVNNNYYKYEFGNVTYEIVEYY